VQISKKQFLIFETRLRVKTLYLTRKLKKPSPHTKFGVGASDERF
jgi:hypothetical protein